MVDSQMIQQYAALRTKAEILSTRGELLSPVEQQTMDRLLSYAQTSLSPSELARTADAVDALVAQGHQQAMMQQSQHDAARALRAQDEVTRDLTGGQLQFAHQLAPAAAGEKYVVPGKQGIHPDTMESTVKGMMSDLGKPDGYVRRQVEGWSERYRKARTKNAPSYERVMQWLELKMPSETRACLIHGDFRFDNVVLDPQDPLRVIGVLDWEMATIGDPLMDLGNSLAYWIQRKDPLLLRLMRLQPTNLGGMLTRDEVVDYYCEKTGVAIDSFDFYRIYGLFRLVVIMQQIYYRYFNHQTRNKRFGRFIYLIKYLDGYLNRLIDRSSL